MGSSAVARLVAATLVAALMVFSAVQDRVTAAGARRYVALQRAALAAGHPPLTADDVMTPAVRASVWLGLAWSGGVAVLGLTGAAVIARRRRRG